jgi:uncharacterized protein YutE (UPF0331/DUF86 family)
VDDIILNKVQTIEKCIARINETYIGFKNEIKTNYDKQDVIVLNLQRACEAIIDMGARIIRKKKLGLYQTNKEIFEILKNNKLLDEKLSFNLQKMIGFRNIAVHDYKALSLPIVISIIEKHLNDFEEFCKIALSIN